MTIVPFVLINKRVQVTGNNSIITYQYSVANIYPITYTSIVRRSGQNFCIAYQHRTTLHFCEFCKCVSHHDLSKTENIYISPFFILFRWRQTSMIIPLWELTQRIVGVSYEELAFIWSSFKMIQEHLCVFNNTNTTYSSPRVNRLYCVLPYKCQFILME